MDSFLIQGGTALTGTIDVSGAKNAALPILSACLMAGGVSKLHGVPRLSDIDSMIDLLRALGCRVTRQENAANPVHGGPSLNGRLDVEVTDAKGVEAGYDIVSKMRASISVLGPLLASRGRAVVSLPGGCAIGDRPVDLHLRGLSKLGATFDLEGGNIVGSVKGRLKGARMYLGGASGPTVLGTINVMCAATLAEGETVIVGAACEPEVTDTANLLNKMGARITGQGTPEIKIDGVDTLSA
ncbi:MAG TPA: UDP-N-acetylglucosamine 1-carboxyvinyltransferase, partial [Tepidisphaeraceae bacterium]